MADGFYEWKKSGKAKQPYFIHMNTDEPFVFAGLWERWKNDDRVIESYTIITTEPNSLVAELHDRMPVIVPNAEYDLRLDPEFQTEEKLLSILRPYSADEMAAYPVSTLVNNPRHEDAKCVEAMTT